MGSLRLCTPTLIRVVDECGHRLVRQAPATYPQARQGTGARRLRTLRGLKRSWNGYHHLTARISHAFVSQERKNLCCNLRGAAITLWRVGIAARGTNLVLAIVKQIHIAGRAALFTRREGAQVFRPFPDKLLTLV